MLSVGPVLCQNGSFPGIEACLQGRSGREGGGPGVDGVEVVTGRGGGGDGSKGVMSWQCDDVAICFVITLWEWYVVQLLLIINNALWCSGYVVHLCLISYYQLVGSNLVCVLYFCIT